MKLCFEINFRIKICLIPKYFEQYTFFYSSQTLFTEFQSKNDFMTIESKRDDIG